MKQILKEVMTPLPQTVGATATIKKAVELMEEHQCRHLPVLDGGRLVGMLSQKDIQLTFSNANQILVRDVMSTEPLIMEPSATLKEAVDEMIRSHVSSVIVSSYGTSPWGIFTSTDALKILSQCLN